jgi:hypothetical protein
MEKSTLQQETLFNIPFWGIRIINFEEKKKKLVKLLESYPEEKEKYDEMKEGEFATNRQIDRTGLVEQFGSVMKQELEDFSREINKDLAIIDIWSVSYETGDSQSVHNHSSVGLTGILYLDLPKDSPITTYMQPWTDHETDTIRHADIPIIEGDIVIVPSFVLHFSSPNNSKNKKRIISWDMKMNPQIVAPPNNDAGP